MTYTWARNDAMVTSSRGNVQFQPYLSMEQKASDSMKGIPGTSGQAGRCSSRQRCFSVLGKSYLCAADPVSRSATARHGPLFPLLDTATQKSAHFNIVL